MPQFTSNIAVLPNDTITPAVNDLAGNMMKMTQFKAVEQERRDAKLAELASVSLGNVFAGDNAELQKSKEDYINEVVKGTASSRGRIPWQQQAELLAKKQQLLQKAAVSEEHRKEYLDVMKKAVSDPAIDKEETLRSLQSWSQTPLSDRSSAWTVIQPRVSLQEYFGKNIKSNPVETTYVKGNEIHKKEVFESLPQMMAIVSENQLIQNKVSKEMEQSGIPKPANGYNSAQIGTYLQKTYGSMFDKNNDTFTVKTPRASSTTIVNMPPSSNEPVPGNKRQLTSAWSVDNKQKVNTQNYTYGNEIPTKQSEVIFPAGQSMDMSMYAGPTESTLSPKMKVTTIREMPVIYRKPSKGKAGWYLATDEYLAAHPDQQGKVEYKRYLVGTSTSTEEVPDPNDKLKKISKSVQRELAIPATDINLAAYKKSLPAKEQAGFKIEPENFGTTKRERVSIKTLMADNPGASEQDVRNYFKETIDITD